MRKWPTLAGITASVAGLGVIGLTSAMPASADATGILNLFNAPGLCVQTHGSNPATIENNGAGCTSFVFHHTGGTEWQIKPSGTNKCLTVKTSLANKVISQDCTAGNNAQSWVPNNTDRETWAPVLNLSWRLGVYNDVPGHPLYGDGGVTWTGWVIRV